MSRARLLVASLTVSPRSEYGRDSISSFVNPRSFILSASGLEGGGAKLEPSPSFSPQPKMAAARMISAMAILSRSTMTFPRMLLDFCFGK